MYMMCTLFSRFAELAAAVFLSKKIKVYLFSGHTPTPYTVSMNSSIM